MQYARTARRSVLLALTLLSACAASDPSSGADPGQVPAGVIGNFLAGRFAMAEGDPATAANDLLKAVAESPGDPDLTLEAFIACLNAGRPETVRLAAQLPDSQVAQLVLADVDIKAGRWQDAETRFHSLPRQGMTQLLQPLLVAWAQQGDGRTDTALSTLRPVCREPPVSRSVHSAGRDDRGPWQSAGGCRRTVSRGREHYGGAEPASGADSGELAGALRPGSRGAAGPWPRCRWARPICRSRCRR